MTDNQPPGYDIALINNSKTKETITVAVYQGRDGSESNTKPYWQSKYTLEGNINPSQTDKPTSVRDNIKVPGKGVHELVVIITSDPDKPLEHKNFVAPDGRFPENHTFSFYISAPPSPHDYKLRYKQTDSMQEDNL